MNRDGLDYRQAGVDIDAANRSVELIKQWVDKTRRPEVLAGIGGFGGFFALDTSRYTHPVLVSGTDGVGTKLKIAQMMDIHSTVGIDLVAMCANDILVHGAEPLFFLDYIAVGKLNPGLVEELVRGVSEGCLQAGCSLIGGETAEMPGFYKKDEYDLAGFTVGAVDQSRLLTARNVGEGDILIGLPSSGVHSNGFSLVRKVLLERAGLRLEQTYEDLGHTLGEELLTPTRIYVKSVLSLLQQVDIHAMAHITGGGIAENLQRSLPEGLGAEVDSSRIPERPVFDMVARLGSVEKEEMYRTFNMGIGLILITSPQHSDNALKCLRDEGEKPIVIGRVGRDIKGVVVK